MMNLPNFITCIRLALIPAFVCSFTGASTQGEYALSALLLVLSGFTDMLDGYIARKYNLVTNLGKILDPLADKLTLTAVTCCLWVRVPELWPIFAFFLAKEFIMIVAGLFLIKKNRKLEGARWFGKLYTVVFYLVMTLVILLPDMNSAMRTGMLVFMGVFTAFTFVMYIPVFFQQNQRA